jgi:hypothetical protein
MFHDAWSVRRQRNAAHDAGGRLAIRAAVEQSKNKPKEFHPEEVRNRASEI